MASNARPGRRSLSDRLRGMRFMKHKEETEIREKLAAEQEKREKEAQWTLGTIDDTNETMPIVIIENGVSDNPMLGRAGRQSFGNFNPVLEMKPATKESKEEGELDNDKPMVEEENRSAERRKDRGKKNKLLGVRGGIWKNEPKLPGNRFQIKANRSHKRSR